MTKNEAGWHVRTTKGKRGKHRFTIYDGSEIKAIAPINMAFESEGGAQAAGEAVLHGLANGAELEQLRQSGAAKDREIDDLRAQLETAQGDNRTLGQSVETLNRRISEQGQRIETLAGEDERNKHHLGIANSDREKLRARMNKAEGQVSSWKWRCIAVFVLAALACWLISIAVR